MLAADRTLYRFQLHGYWADIGQPKDFLRGTGLYLASLASSTCAKEEDGQHLAKGEGIIGNVLIHSTATVGKDCLIGPNVTIGPYCIVGDGVRIKNSAIMEGVKIDGHCYLEESIVGWQSLLGRWVRHDNRMSLSLKERVTGCSSRALFFRSFQVRLEGLTVVGEDVSISSECFVNQSFILPHKIITTSIMESGKVVM